MINAARCILALAVVPALFAQTAEATRVVHFTKLVNVQQLNDVSKAIASVGGFAAPTVGEADHTLTATGTPAQLAYFEWVATRLDVDPQTQPVHAVVGDHLMAGNAGDIVRIFRIAHASSLQQFQEMATVIRSITEVRYLYSSWTSGSIIIRGIPAYVDLGQWLADRLDRTGAELDYNSHQYDLPASTATLAPRDSPLHVTVFRVANAATIRDFQEVVTAVRSITEIRGVISFGTTATIVIRSSTADAEVAGWVLQQLDRKGPGAVAEYRYPAVDEVINVIYLPQSITPEELQQRATQARQATNSRRFFTYTRLRAVLVREVEERVAQVRKLLAEPVVAGNQQD